jgi:hypothetical protein
MSSLARLKFPRNFQDFLGYLERHKSEIHLAKHLVRIQLIPTVASIAGILLE